MMLSRYREVMGKARSPCRQEQPSAGSDADAYHIDHSGCRERKVGVNVGVRVSFVLAVRTSGLAGLGAGTERLFDNALDGARTAAAFDAATEAAIDLLGIARKIQRRADGTPDIVVAKDVAGTDDHENGRAFADAEPIDI